MQVSASASRNVISGATPRGHSGDRDEHPVLGVGPRVEPREQPAEVALGRQRAIVWSILRLVAPPAGDPASGFATFRRRHKLLRPSRPPRRLTEVRRGRPRIADAWSSIGLSGIRHCCDDGGTEGGTIESRPKYEAAAGLALLNSRGALPDRAGDPAAWPRLLAAAGSGDGAARALAAVPARPDR